MHLLQIFHHQGDLNGLVDESYMQRLDSLINLNTPKEWSKQNLAQYIQMKYWCITAVSGMSRSATITIILGALFLTLFEVHSERLALAPSPFYMHDESQMSEKEKVFALLRCVWYRRKGNEEEENKSRMSLGSLSSFGKVKKKRKKYQKKMMGYA